MTLQVIETLTVPSNGTTVTSTKKTVLNETYLIRLSGTISYHLPDTWQSDGVWTYEPPSGGWILHTNLRFQINGSDVTYPVRSINHEYTFKVAGNNDYLTFKLRDNPYTDNSGSLNVKILRFESAHDGSPYCPVNDVGDDSKTLKNPISARFGEKREEITDLQVMTPVGPMAFTRYYRQSKLDDPNYQFMGLGWTHEHDFTLTAISGTPNRITVYMPNGGEASFTQTISYPNVYEGDLGSTALINVNPGSSSARYTLSAIDGSTYVFDADGLLQSRAWANGEAWTYDYDGSDNLTEVDDGYGRKLVFSYVDDPGQFDDGQLWRVGDNTAADLDTNSPSGRYVEFSYLPEKDDGVLVSSPKALLAQVRDVRGHEWTYDYYGQVSGEDDDRQLNYLVRRQTPSVDTTGDDTPDGAITLEEVSYSFDTQLAVNGSMEADSDWSNITGAAPTTNQRSTAQVDSGSYSRYVLASAANQGIQGQHLR